MYYEGVPQFNHRPMPPELPHRRILKNSGARERLYPQKAPFSAREKFRLIEEERKKPIVSTLNNSPRFSGNFTINGVELHPVEKIRPPREKVDQYIEMLKKSRPKVPKIFTPHNMLRSQIPYSLVNAHTEQSSERAPAGITKEFDRSPRFRSHPKEFEIKMPDSEIARDFKRFIEDNGERIPEVLDDVKA